MPRQRDYRALAKAAINFDNAKTVLFLYVLLNQVIKAKRHLWARGLFAPVKDLYIWLSHCVVRLLLRMPSTRKRVDVQMNQAKLDIEDKIVPKGAAVVHHLSLPERGKSLEWILAEMDKMDVELDSSIDWRKGKLSGAVYHGGDELKDVIVAAFKRYYVANPLHPNLFPAVRKMEAEVVAMCLDLYANAGGAGVMTSGGTESIIMAIKTYRDWARAVKGITEPEMILPCSAHTAFNKGAAYLNVKVHTIPVDQITRRVNLKRVKRAINPNTIMLVGSAVNFPDGCQDDIPALGALAAAYSIGLHVDCCLGSFIVPYVEKAGLADGEDGSFKLLPFDFRVKGVTSISCDTHKYGFTPKGTSVVMYRDADLRRFQYYINPSWSGGVYASPSFPGSRPGSLIAGAWAVMQYMGSQGYLDSCRAIVASARSIVKAIRTSIPELYVLGDPPASVVAFASKDPDVNVLEVGDAMSKRGWHLSALANPPAVHISCTRRTDVDSFIADLKDSVNEVKSMPSGKGTMVAVYGLGHSSPVGPSMVGQLATAFLDALYKA